jgi:hypothetical protein
MKLSELVVLEILTSKIIFKTFQNDAVWLRDVQGLRNMNSSSIPSQFPDRHNQKLTLFTIVFAPIYILVRKFVKMKV